MATEHTIYVHWGGEISIGIEGFTYNGGTTKRVKLSSNPTFDELFKKLETVTRLRHNERISSIVYRFPQTSQGILVWGHLYINDDDDLDAVFENFQLGHQNWLELYVVKERGAQPVTQGFDLNEDVSDPVLQADADIHVADRGMNMVTDTMNEELQPSLLSHEPISMSFQPPNVELMSVYAAGSSNPLVNDNVVGPSRVNDDVSPILPDPFLNNEYASDDGAGEDDVAEFYDNRMSDGEEEEEQQQTNIGSDIIADAAVGRGRILDSANTFIFPSEHHEMFNVEGMSAQQTLTRNINRWADGADLARGMLFSSKDELRRAVRQFSIRRHVNFCVIESKRSFWSIRCVRGDEGCSWRLRAKVQRNSPFWEITIYDGLHTCSAPTLSQDHRQLGSDIIATYILDMVSKDPSLKVDVIVENMRTMFNHEVSYKKAWNAKRRALEQVFGNWEESYHKLPRYLLALQTYNPGTATEIDVTSMEGGSVTLFRRAFWAFRASIDGFNFCKPVLCVDGTFLYGKYAHTLLIASAVDGNNKIFPVAFGIVESENNLSWAWFMHCIRKYVTQRQELCVVSDRHMGIVNAMSNPEIGWDEASAYHRYCLRHVVSNYNRAHRKPSIKDMLYRAGTLPRYVICAS